MRINLSLFLIAISLGVSGCQVTSGRLTSSEMDCQPISINDASANWAVFGTVVKAENCTGRNHIFEKYKLTNGWVNFQESYGRNIGFVEISERVFREWLKGIKAFADTANTIKIHFPYIKERPTIFAHLRNPSGRQYIAFQMDYGFPNETDYNGYTVWSKANSGILYDNGAKSEGEFQKYFLERLKAFDTPKAENFIDSNSQKNRTTSSTPKVKSSSTGSITVRPIAVEWEGYGKLIAGKIELNQKKGGGSISMQLPDNDGSCTGNYKHSTKQQGTWAMACTNGSAASGTFQVNGPNRGSSGEGTDTKGRKVKYTVGAG